MKREDRSSLPSDDDDDDHHDDEVEAALTLATLPVGENLPAHVRGRVETQAFAFFETRAQERARARTEDRTRESLRNMQSTTAAGSQVVAVLHTSKPDARRQSRPLVAWSGWAFAAAASVALVVSLSRTSAQSGLKPHDDLTPETLSGAADHLTLEGVGSAAGSLGEVRYDRNHGTGVVHFPPALATATAKKGESLELWLVFEGDVAPRAIAKIETSNADFHFGEDQAICQGSPLTARPEERIENPPCLPLRQVFVTREASPGSLLFLEENVVAHAASQP